MNLGWSLSSIPEACLYIADNCSANILICENKAQLAKILQVPRTTLDVAMQLLEVVWTYSVSFIVDC